MALVPRAIESQLRETLRESGAVMLRGPRQAGKTTLTRQLQAAGEPLHYFNLDDDATRSAARADPEGFALSLPHPAVIDEAQRAPGLLPGIRRIVARDPRPGRFLLTGSADIALGGPPSRDRAQPEADATPIAALTLWPLAQAELVGDRGSVIDLLLDGTPPHITGAPKGRAATAELVLAGGFPPACVMTAPARAEYFAAYVQAIIAQDLPEVGELRLDPSKLARLLALLAARTNGAVNFAALARALAVDDKTVKAHTDLLTRLLQLLPVPAWTVDVGARQVKAPKLLLCDSGMAAALVGLDVAGYAAPERGPLARMLLETFVVMELAKQATWSAGPVALSYYRDTEKREVDLVIESHGGDVAAVTVSAATTVDPGALRGLRLLRDRLGSRLRCAVVVYTGEDTVSLGDRIWALPLWGVLR